MTAQQSFHSFVGRPRGLPVLLVGLVAFANHRQLLRQHVHREEHDGASCARSGNRPGGARASRRAPRSAGSWRHGAAAGHLRIPRQPADAACGCSRYVAGRAAVGRHVAGTRPAHDVPRHRTRRTPYRPHRGDVRNPHRQAEPRAFRGTPGAGAPWPGRYRCRR
jgi:hypothetical protein